MDVFILAAWEREVLWRLMWRGSHLNVTLRCETILPGQLFTFPRFAKNLDFLRQVLGACEAKWKRGSIFLAGPYKATPGTKCEKLRLNINIFRYVFVYLLIKMYNPIIRCLIDRNEPFSSSEKEPESNKIFIHFWWISECAVHNSDSSSVLYDIPLSYFAFLLQSKTRLSPYIWKVLAISLLYIWHIGTATISLKPDSFAESLRSVTYLILSQQDISQFEHFCTLYKISKYSWLATVPAFINKANIKQTFQTSPSIPHICNRRAVKNKRNQAISISDHESYIYYLCVCTFKL